MSINSANRVFTCGKTGSGKTFLMSYLASKISRLIVLDGKGTLGNWGLEDWSEPTKKRFIKGEKLRLRVTYNPAYDPSEIWEDALRAVYEAGNCTIYIDEIYAIVPPHTKPSNYLWAIWTRGRELNIGGWASTQRPSYIPLFFISEADHFFMFRLMLEDDRKKMAAFMTPIVMNPIRDKHGFFYMSAEDDFPTYIKQFKP